MCLFNLYFTYFNHKKTLHPVNLILPHSAMDQYWSIYKSGFVMTLHFTLPTLDSVECQAP